MNIKKIRKVTNKYIKLLGKLEEEKTNELNNQIEQVMEKYSKEVDGEYIQKVKTGNLIHEVYHKPIIEESVYGLKLEVVIGHSDIKFIAMSMDDRQQGEGMFTQVVYRDKKEPIEYTINSLIKYMKKVRNFQNNRKNKEE